MICGIVKPFCFARTSAFATLQKAISTAQNGDTVLVWPSWSPQRFCPDTTLWDRDRIVQTLDRARHEIVVQVLTYSPVERRSRDDTPSEDAGRHVA